jgi:glyoxylase-like metal-dependent hydrolase (beta-lactamase superfamily II)
MARWLRVVLVVLVLLLVAAGGGYYWYIGDGSPPGSLPTYKLDMAGVRAAADEMPGSRATDIRVETVATFSFPATASVAGDGWNSVPMAAFSYQVILPADTIVIDAGFVRGQGEEQLNPTYDDDALARMDAGLGEATQIVLTHEHPDHVGGLVDFYRKVPDIARAIRMTPEQLANVGTYQPLWKDAFKDITPIGYDKYFAIAPGVVLIRAPGHTPGSQMIYVKREDGKEVLFVGDIGWLLRNVQTGTGRPRLLSQFMLGEDREAVFAELATLRSLHEAEPDLLIVPGHDVATVDALIAAGVMTGKFRI